MTATKYSVTNTAPGLRGLHTPAGFVELEPGETREVELTAAEFKSAESTGHFDFGGAKAPVADAEPADDLDTTVAKLKEIATAEGVDLPHNASKADIQATIRKARDDKAAAAAGSGSGGGADLDAMDDETLRATVQAITGQAPVADADRETLLKLARGEA